MFPGAVGGGAGKGLKGLLGGVLTGGFLVIAATVLLFWNEGRAVKRADVLAEGRASVIAASPATIEPGNEGRLLHVRGALAASGVLRDPDFGVEAEGLALRRQVEMYQWKETSRGKKDGEKREPPRYEKTWDDELIEHAGFVEPRGHENPSRMPFDEWRQRAPDPRLGAFALSQPVVDELMRWETLAVDAALLPPNLAASLRADGEYLTSAESLTTPAIGDVRIRFQRAPLGAASVIAAQRGGALEPYAARSGELLLVERGTAEAEAMIVAAESRNAGLGWALRAGGFAAYWIGFGLMFAPIGSVLGRIPLLGGIGRFAVGAVSFGLALVLSLLTIVSGWLFHRPWLFGLIILACVAAVFWLARSRRAAPASASAVPPPPPPA